MSAIFPRSIRTCVILFFTAWILGAQEARTLDVAEQALHAGATGRAEQILQQLLREDPNNAETVNLLGEVRIQQMRVEGARQAFQRAIALQPGFSPALENLALLDLMIHCDAEAAATAKHLLAIDAQNYNAHLVLGITLLNSGRAAGALSHFTLLHSSDPRDPFGLAGLMECHRKLGDTRLVEADRNALRSVSVEPKDALLASQVFHRGPLHSYVLPWLEAAHRFAPGDYPVSIALAEAYVDERDYLRANDCLHEVLTRNDNDPLVLLKLSSVDAKLGNDAEALKNLYQAKTALTADPKVLIVYATVCLQRRMFPEARLALETAKRLAPESANVRYLLGIAYLSLKDAKAEDELSKAVEINSGSASALTALGVYHLSNGGLDKACSFLSQAVRIDPSQAPAQYYLGQCYRKGGRSADAVNALQRSIVLAPRDGRPHAELGNVFMGEGRAQQAESEFRKAIALDPTLASAHYRLATLLRRSGRPADASIEFHRADQLRKAENDEAIMELVPQSSVP